MCVLTQQTAGADFRFSGEKLDRIQGWFLPAGATVCVQEREVYYGAEMSIVNLSDFFPFMWLGLYCDYNTNAVNHQFSIGPEFGWFFFGFDTGYLGYMDENGYHHGFTIRLLASVPLRREIDHIFPLLSPYIRYSYVYGEGNILQYGILIKVAIKLD